MNKNLLLSLLFVTGSYHLATAQNFNDMVSNSGKNLFTEGRFKIFFRYTHMSGTYTEPLAMPTVNFSIRSDRSHKNGLRYSYENSTIGDGIFTLFRGFKRLNNGTNGSAGTTVDHTEKTLASGLVGWHKIAMNVLSRGRLLVALGISVGDHMISTTLRTGSQAIIPIVGHENYIGGSTQTIDPAGYYFYAGPYVIASYVINRRLWIDAYANYDFTVVKAFHPKKNYVKNADYPLPTVWMCGADLYTPLKVFAGVRYAKMNDTGIYKNKAQRIDVSVGYHF